MFYIYLAIGYVVSLMCISYYRNDGTTNEEGELYAAAVSPLIWPLMLLKVGYDYLVKFNR